MGAWLCVVLGGGEGGGRGVTVRVGEREGVGVLHRGKAVGRGGRGAAECKNIFGFTHQMNREQGKMCIPGNLSPTLLQHKWMTDSKKCNQCSATYVHI